MVEKVLQARFFRQKIGGEPVRDWLLTLSREDRRRIGVAIAKVEIGWPIGLPVCRPMADGLYEVRVALSDRIARVLFCIEDGEMILLHGFIKKERATPRPDLVMARKRMKAFRDAR